MWHVTTIVNSNNILYSWKLWTLSLFTTKLSVWGNVYVIISIYSFYKAYRDHARHDKYIHICQFKRNYFYLIKTFQYASRSSHFRPLWPASVCLSRLSAWLLSLRAWWSFSNRETSDKLCSGLCYAVTQRPLFLLPIWEKWETSEPLLGGGVLQFLTRYPQALQSSRYKERNLQRCEWALMGLGEQPSCPAARPPAGFGEQPSCPAAHPPAAPLQWVPRVQRLSVSCAGIWDHVEWIHQMDE